MVFPAVDLEFSSLTVKDLAVLIEHLTSGGVTSARLRMRLRLDGMGLLVEAVPARYLALKAYYRLRQSAPLKDKQELAHDLEFQGDRIHTYLVAHPKDAFPDSPRYLELRHGFGPTDDDGRFLAPDIAEALDHFLSQCRAATEVVDDQEVIRHACTIAQIEEILELPHELLEHHD